MDFLTATATEIADAVGRKEISAEEVATAFISRIEVLEPSVRAFSWYDPDDILRQAQELDRGERGGPLAGVPLGVKDVFDVAGVPTEFFSPIYAGNRPSRDAAVVARLKALGAIMVGKTATTEFAYMHTGPTRNPHDPERTPGSSSAGSGAGMASGFFPWPWVHRPQAPCWSLLRSTAHSLTSRASALSQRRASSRWLRPSIQSAGSGEVLKTWFW